MRKINVNGVEFKWIAGGNVKIQCSERGYSHIVPIQNIGDTAPSNDQLDGYFTENDWYYYVAPRHIRAYILKTFNFE